MQPADPNTLAARRRLLSDIPLFAGVSPAGIDLLAGLAAESTVRAGHRIVQEDEPGTKLFLLADGEARVLRRTSQGELEVARIRAGDFFGEMSILERLPRSASVEAVTDSRLLILSYAAFDVLIQRRTADHHTIVQNLARSLSARLRSLGDTFALRG